MIFIFNLILISILSSFIPLILGAFFALCFKKKSSWIDLLLFVSSGTIMALVCFDLFPELWDVAQNEFSDLGFFYLLIIIVLTFLCMLLIHHLIDKIEHKKHGHDHNHIDTFIEKKEKSLFKAGIFLLISLVLHNFPEGVSLGALLKNSFQEGVSLGFFLALHNLIMGMSLSLPLLLTNTKKRNIFFLLVISFLPSLIGSIVGYLCLDLNQVLTFIILAIASGILLYVVFEELLPIMHMKKHKIAAILCFIISFLIFMFIHQII